MSFAVGDRVRITEDHSGLQLYGINCPEEVAGREGSVVETSSSDQRVVVPGARRRWWYRPDMLTRIENDASLLEYKTRVVAVAREVKEREGWCDDGFKEVLGKLDLLDVAFPPTPEPSPGSVARHQSNSVVYVRPWGCGLDGGESNWSKDGTTEKFGWRQIQDEVVVIQDTEGRQRYDS